MPELESILKKDNNLKNDLKPLKTVPIDVSNLSPLKGETYSGLNLANGALPAFTIAALDLPNSIMALYHEHAYP